MMEPDDAAELRRRRNFMVQAGLLYALIAAGSALMGVLDGDRVFYFGAAFFVGLSVVEAGRLFTPPEVLLELPAYFFSWFAPSRVEAQNCPCEMRTIEKPTHLKPAVSPSLYGVMGSGTRSHPVMPGS